MRSARVAVLGITLAGFGLCLYTPEPAPARDPQDLVEPMVAKAVNYLKKASTNGGWVVGPAVDENVGLTALVGLALMEAKTQDSDRLAQQALAYVKQNVGRVNQMATPGTNKSTYGLAFATIFLDRMKADTGTIAPLVARLAASQDPDTGCWGYTSNPLDPAAQKRLADQLRLKKKEKIPQPKAQGQIAADHSNTQLALLALWIGRNHKIDVEFPVLYTEKHFRAVQGVDGGWGYSPSPGNASMSMTCAGLIALCLGFGAQTELHESVARGGSSTKVGDDKGGQAVAPATPRPTKESLMGDPAVLSARAYITKYVGSPTFLQDVRQYRYYTLWSLERVCVAYGWDNLDGKDWFAWGVNILQGLQDAQGAWSDELECGAIADTAFAILFLKKANLIKDVTSKLTSVARGSQAPAGASGTPRNKGEKDAAERLQKEMEEKQKKDAEKRVEEEQKKEVAKLRQSAIFGLGPVQDEAIKRLRDTPGRPDFTKALAEVCAETNGGLQNRCREALAERLARFKASVLENYLTGEDRELRLGAAAGSALRGNKDMIPKLIPVLNDKVPEVAQRAYESLKVLAGQDFGMDATKWMNWWNKNGAGAK